MDGVRMYRLNDFFTRFYWMQCHIDEYILVHWIPAVHAGMTALRLVVISIHFTTILDIRLVPTLQRGNLSGNAPALRDAGASLSAFPRRSVGTIGWGYLLRVTLTILAMHPVGT